MGSKTFVSRQATLSRNHSTSGSALISVVMLGAASLAVVGYGVNYLTQQQKITTAARQKNNFNQNSDLLKIVGGTAAQCKNIFDSSGVDLAADNFNINGGNVTTETLTQITVPNNGNQVLKPSDPVLKYMAAGLRVTSITLERPGTSNGTNSFDGVLVITATREMGKSGRGIAAQLTERIAVNLLDGDADGNFDSCTVPSTIAAGPSPSAEQPRTEIVVSQSEPADFLGSTCATIQSAITSAESGSGVARTVLIKAGTYTGCKEVYISGANVKIRGEGNATILMSTADSVKGAIIVGASGVQITDLLINQSGSSAGTSVQPVSAISIEGGTSNILIERVTFRTTNAPGAAANSAITIGTASAADIINLQIKNNFFGNPANTSENYRGYMVMTNDDAGTLDGLVIEGNNAPSLARYSEIYLELGGGSIYLSSKLKNVRITDNIMTCTSTLADAIARAIFITDYQIGSNVYAKRTAENVTIKNNQIYVAYSSGVSVGPLIDSGAGGILFYYYDNDSIFDAMTVIENNITLDTAGGDPTAGILLYYGDLSHAPYGQFLITQNKINLIGGGQGITLYGADSSLIANNLIENGSLFTGKSFIVSDNQINNERINVGYYDIGSFGADPSAGVVTNNHVTGNGSSGVIGTNYSTTLIANNNISGLQPVAIYDNEAAMVGNLLVTSNIMRYTATDEGVKKFMNVGASMHIWVNNNRYLDGFSTAAICVDCGAYADYAQTGI